ncbi:MAG: hypothetical protein LBR18_05750 [Tannerella sp.]|jgi:hypothetical protein|nr:hypothetical protein [Tannerella sp.]
MKTKLFLLISIFSCGSLWVQAQEQVQQKEQAQQQTPSQVQNWSREDSLWLLNILEGKQELKINEDTKKAIEEGKLIMPQWLKDNDKINILKDLGSAGALDSVRMQSIDPFSMPPAVFALYVLYIDKVDSILQNTTVLLTPAERETLMQYLPVSSNRVYVNEYGVGGIGNLDFNHILSMIFSPSYRLKAHNSKYATAYKNYYDEGALPALQMTERERKQLRQAVRQVKVEFSNTMGGGKRNTIDN